MKKIISLILVLVFICSMLSFLFPASAFSGDDRIVIVLDPGHGGHPHDNNTGTSGRGVNEKDLTLKVANLVKAKLEANGSFIVYMTRTADTTIEVCDRGIFANTVNADVLISFHFDSNNDSSLNGTTALISVLDKYALTTLGSSMTSAISNAVGLANRGNYQRYDNAGYYWDTDLQWDFQDSSRDGGLSDYYGIPTWCAKFGIKSMIIEQGYMSNSHDLDIILDNAKFEKMAEAEANAIINYYTNHTHTYGAATRDFQSNCVFQGKQSEKCTICSHRRNITMLEAAPENHYWENEVKTPASCGVDGSVTRTCRITSNLNKKGHYIAEHKETTVIPAPTQHEYKLVESVEVTHTVNGYKKYTCKNCSKTYYDYTYAEGHTFEYVETREATCTEDGGNLYRCKVCKAEYTDGIKATGHTMKVTENITAGCENDGHLTKVCDVCGETETKVYKKLGHNYLLTDLVLPDCVNEGSTTHMCANCKTVITNSIEPLGHEMVETITPATLLTPSYTRIHCDRNFDVIETGYDYPEWVPYALLAGLAVSFAMMVTSLSCLGIFLKKLENGYYD